MVDDRRDWDLMEEGALAGFLAFYFATMTAIILSLLLAWGRKL
jgi:hypothetical protein